MGIAGSHKQDLLIHIQLAIYSLDKSQTTKDVAEKVKPLRRKTAKELEKVLQGLRERQRAVGGILKD